MSGAWYALAAVAVGLVIRWYIKAEGRRSETEETARTPAKRKVRFGP